MLLELDRKQLRYIVASLRREARRGEIASAKMHGRKYASAVVCYTEMHRLADALQINAAVFYATSEEIIESQAKGENNV